ncbi:MAG: hypothetical protein QQN63_01525 [Nitrosopumilus sp.]
MKAGGELLKTVFEAGIWKQYIGTELSYPGEIKVGPNSVDVTLHCTILVPDANMTLDLKDHTTCHYSEHHMDGSGWVIFPHGFILGAVNERFDSDAPIRITQTNSFRDSTDVYFTQEVHGRSTLGRCGLCIHATAGYGDYGFKGAFTLELFNVTNRPIILYPDIKVAQVEFNSVKDPAIYKGRYSKIDH